MKTNRPKKKTQDDVGADVLKTGDCGWADGRHDWERVGATRVGRVEKNGCLSSMGVRMGKGFGPKGKQERSERRGSQDCLGEEVASGREICGVFFLIFTGAGDESKGLRLVEGWGREKGSEKGPRPSTGTSRLGPVGRGGRGQVGG